MKKVINLLFILSLFCNPVSSQPEGWGDYSEIFFGQYFGNWWHSEPSIAQVPNSEDVIISYGGSILRRGAKEWDRQHVPTDIHPFEGQTHFIETTPNGFFVSWDYLRKVDSNWSWDRIHVFAEFDYEGNLLSQSEFFMQTVGFGSGSHNAYSYAGYLLDNGNIITVEYKGNDRIRCFDKTGNLLWNVKSPIVPHDEKPSVIQLANETIVLVSKSRWVAFINPENGDIVETKEFSNELNKDIILGKDKLSFYLLKEGEIKYCDNSGSTLKSIKYPKMELAKNKAWVELDNGVVAILGHSEEGFILKKVDLVNELVISDSTYSDFGNVDEFRSDFIIKSGNNDILFFGLSIESLGFREIKGTMRAIQIDAITGEIKRSWENDLFGESGDVSVFRNKQEFVEGLVIGDYCYIGTQFIDAIINNSSEEALESELVIFGLGERIVGEVFEDSNENCQKDSSELSISNATIKFITKNGAEYSATSNDEGFFEILLRSEVVEDDSLSYTVSYNGQRIEKCNIDISSFSSDELANLFIPLQEKFCANLIVNNYSNPPSTFQWSCTKSNQDWLRFSISNRGFYSASNSYCILELDSFLTLSELDMAYDQITDDSIKIDIGQIDVGSFVTIYLKILGDCDAPSGKPLCMKLTVFPNQECINSSPDKYFVEYCTTIENLTQVNSHDKEKRKIFPNPSTNQINFNFQNPISKALQFELYNIAGQKVLFREVSGDFMIEKSEVGSGVFFFEMRESGGVMERGKVVFL